MTQMNLAELIEGVNRARARFVKLTEERDQLLNGKEKVLSLLEQAKKKLNQAEDEYRHAVVYSSDQKKEVDARTALESARAEAAQAQDRLNAFEQMEGEAFSRVNEQAFRGARTNLENLKDRAWRELAQQEMARFPPEALEVLKRAYAAGGVGSFSQYAAFVMDTFSPSQEERFGLRKKLSEEYGLEN